MPDDSSFLHALLARPDDNGLRLVYADWLEECGDPRSTFLRLEVALHEATPAARTHELRERLHQARQSLDARWLALADRPLAGWRNVRTTSTGKTYGKAIPAFIHNGSYYLANVNVYADGAIDCWGFVDVPLFHDKLAQGWVVPQAEVGDTISIHNLGVARVAAAQWDLTPADMESQVMDTLRELNPTMQGLLDMQGTDTEICNGVRTAKLGWNNAKPYRVSLAGGEVMGAELPVFEAAADGYRLRRWFVYADGQSQLGYANVLLSLETVTRMIEEGRVTLSVPAGAWITLDGLGRFQAREWYQHVKPGERIREAFSLLEELNGGPGAIGRCRDAHRAYEADPSQERREALRRAYEAVPEHQRRFCGDMDSRDGPIRRILSGMQTEIE